MAKLTLNNVGNILGNPTSAQTTINNNSDLIEAAIENTLSRDGTTPNQMLADIDLNNNDLLNVATLDADDIIYRGTSFSDTLEDLQEAAEQIDEKVQEASQYAANAKISETEARSSASRAAGYVNDIVSEKEVPITATRNGMEVLEFPAGMNSLETRGYAAAGDGGGALYKKVVSEPAHAGKVQSADGAWWEIAEASPSALAFGCRPEYVEGNPGFDNSTNAQAYINYCLLTRKGIYFPGGRYYFGSGLNVTRSKPDTGSFHDNPAPAFRGDGVRATQFYFSSGAYDCITFVGGYNNADNPSWQQIEDLAVNKLARTGHVIVLSGHFHAHLKDVRVMGGNIGLFCVDVHETLLTNFTSMWNNVGMLAKKGMFTQPNIMTLVGCTIGSNLNLGIDVHNPATFTMIGGSIEGNGIGGTDPVKWGIRAIYDTTFVEGSVGLNMYGVYLEANLGDADIFIVNGGFAHAVQNIQGCSFQRTSGTNFSQNCIRVDWSGTTYKNVLNLMGNGFRHFNDYTPNAGRQYVNLTGGAGSPVMEVNEFGNFYASSVEKSSLALNFKGFSKELMGSAYAEVLANGTLSAGRNVTSSSKSETGTYLITFRTPMDNILFTPSIISIGDGPCVFRVTAISTTTMTIEARNPASNALQDCRFTMSIQGGRND